MRRIFNTLVCGLLLCCGAFLQEAKAAIRTVDNTTDNGALTACGEAANDCSLRGAVTGAGNGDTINFDPSLNGSTITLDSLINIPTSLAIMGPGADKLTISGGGTTSLFEAVVIASTTFSGLTFANGNGVGGGNGGQGGAIEVNSGALATFDSVVFRDNSAAIIGGALLCAVGTCRISNSTFVNNSSPQAAVFYQPSGTLEMMNTTISGNHETSSTYGAFYTTGNGVIRNSTIVNNTARCGMYKSGGGTLTLGNTIIAGNTGSDIFVNFGSLATNGGNLIGNNLNAGATFASAGTPNANSDYVGTGSSQINPQLAPLSNYGGGTPTYALLSNSPALNAGNNCVLDNSCAPAVAAALITDQRGAGAPRKIGSAVDIGAFERNITLDQSTVPNGQVNVPYNSGVPFQLTATRQTSFANLEDVKSSAAQSFAPTQFVIVPPDVAAPFQQLPPGLSLSTGGQLSGIPTMAGTYSLFVKATDSDGAAGVQQYTMQIFSPTAASVTVSGRVLMPDGRGLRNVRVTLTDQNGYARTVITGARGAYHFAEVAVGELDVITVLSKSYSYAPQAVYVTGEINELNFTASP